MAKKKTNAQAKKPATKKAPATNADAKDSEGVPAAQTPNPNSGT